MELTMRFVKHHYFLRFRYPSFHESLELLDALPFAHLRIIHVFETFSKYELVHAGNIAVGDSAEPFSSRSHSPFHPGTRLFDTDQADNEIDNEDILQLVTKKFQRYENQHVDPLNHPFIRMLYPDACAAIALRDGEELQTPASTSHAYPTWNGSLEKASGTSWVGYISNF
ncbi:hypothetical protein PG997_009138 [Apiospora hydei]|uniref:Uncharacterized protein n=1 Tax=Apiospora hydei TaxID=1337664 RepID=A0ABR1VT75_9PEZI